MVILNGKEYREKLLEEYKEKINNLDITLAIIQVGDEYASNLYINNKIKYCTSAGITVKHFKLLNVNDEDKVISLIDELNNDKNITGIILQSPTPNLDFDKMAETIADEKDVDGFTKNNIFNLYMNNETILPCTVKGIIKLLEFYNIPIESSNVAIVGRGNIVGKPLALALENRNATVTLCNSKTKNLKEITKNSDIIVSAAGVAHLIKEDMVKDGFVGVDVGINRINGKLVGDFDYENIKEKASFITPVPGGVGPMTIAMIIDNLIEMKEKEMTKVSNKVKSKSI